MTDEVLQKRKKIILDIVKDEHYVPMKAKELAILLQVSKEDRPDLDYVLHELVASGEIMLSKRGKYSKPENHILTGTFMATAKGFGFVSVEGMEEDIYIKENRTGGALDKDIVQLVLLPSKGGKRQEGEIIKVISHGIIVEKHSPEYPFYPLKSYIYDEKVRELIYDEKFIISCLYNMQLKKIKDLESKL